MTTNTTTLAGLQFYDLCHVADALQQGARLRWQRDPDNLEDRNAISVWFDREEARAFGIEELIAPGEASRGTWQIGHIERGFARDLAPLLDAGKGLDLFFHSGGKCGAWTVDVRVEGEAADVAEARRAARRHKAELDAERERLIKAAGDELANGLRAVVDRFPGCGWGEIEVDVTVDWRNPDTGLVERLFCPAVFRDAGAERNRRLAAADRIEGDRRARRRAEASAALKPLVDAEARRREEVNARRRAANEARRQATYRGEVEAIMAMARKRGTLPWFKRCHEEFLPKTWLSHGDLQRLSLRPEDCEVVARGTTGHHTVKNFYVPRRG